MQFNGGSTIGGIVVPSAYLDFGMPPRGDDRPLESYSALIKLRRGLAGNYEFQKQIRLQEARRLMLGEDLDAASAGHRMGYENPSYFSREYKKPFGAPPQRDIVQLRSNLELGGTVASV